MMKLWEGRLAGGLDPLAAQLNNSLSFDKRLASQDVRASQAWARALLLAGVLQPFEAEQIILGLQDILEEFDSGTFNFLESDEDIHTAVERRLTELIGPLGGKLHTGRSRNDQVATDFRLWLLETIPRLEVELKDLQAALIIRAEKDWGAILPGYTHFQQAQPVLLSHWWLSHFWALERDGQRLTEIKTRAGALPLGSGALAGTPYPIDRFALAADLGFEGPCPNSLDAVSDRDFAVEVLSWAALLGIHLSRLAEALILYSTAEFGFLTLGDAFSTGSSLMPQKKNPDPLELIRAKSGELSGLLMGFLATLKGLPSAYDKDLQNDKLAVFSAVDAAGIMLPLMSGVIASLEINPQRMLAAIDPGTLATDLADYLVARGVPFREAHHAVAEAAALAASQGTRLNDLSIDEWQAIHAGFGADLYDVFDPQRSIARRSACGGTAMDAVREQIQLAKDCLGEENMAVWLYTWAK
jgi:argininosuccinate lyase